MARAAQEEDPMKRLALIGIYQATTIGQMEHMNHKPVNPLLGETYEYVTDEYELLTEQVSHHPPITAVHIKGKDYRIQFCVQVQVYFNGQYVTVSQKYKTYFFLEKFNETIELIAPVVSTHNIIPLMGSMYNDIGETMQITNLNNPDEKCEMTFHRRGWFTSEKNKVVGKVFR